MCGFSQTTVCLASTMIGIVKDTEEMPFYPANVWNSLQKHTIKMVKIKISKMWDHGKQIGYQEME